MVKGCLNRSRHKWRKFKSIDFPGKFHAECIHCLSVRSLTKKEKEKILEKLKKSE